MQQRIAQLEKDIHAVDGQQAVSLEQIRKDKTRYKKMCVALRNRLTTLIRDNVNSKKEHSAQLQLKNFEISTLSKQLQEVFFYLVLYLFYY